MVISFICIAVAVIIASPPVIALVSFFSPAVAAVLPVVAKGLAATGAVLTAVAGMIPDPASASGGTVESTQLASVIIKEDGVEITDFSTPRELKSMSTVKKFDITLINYSGTLPTLWLYNPETSLWLTYYTEVNGQYIDVFNSVNVRVKGWTDGGPLTLAMSDQIKVNRNSQVGMNVSGYLDLVIYFPDKNNVIINGMPRLIDFNQPNSTNTDFTLINDAGNVCVLKLQNSAFNPDP
ncbi:hypothetical protein AGMMS50230_22860 [Spirochaetia bacterium]|nr:hypothetical protein AGMMS50230_22860 [Spirochaetia bacterium]